MKKAFLILGASIILFASFKFSTHAADVTGKYQRIFDTQLDGVCTGKLDAFGITLTMMPDNSISGSYWGIDNNSLFFGNVLEPSLIQLTQKAPNGYYAVYNGYLDIDGNISGTWIDMRGAKGDFVFFKIK
ncbi:hypothetical protein [Cytophaga aurantiaca]|uniref:hypothetical protein n=1 Tax=Cytophaga aurantiaca TaxID=29530 RepID=UPI000371CFAC|nr:hypothetical protein [Cytophaga aurantiaca]